MPTVVPRPAASEPEKVAPLQLHPAVAAWFGRVVVYEDSDLRGRRPGEMTELISTALTARRPGITVEVASGLSPSDRVIDSPPDSLADNEVVAMIFLLLLAGHDTTANLIGSSIVALLDHPDQIEGLRQDPELIDTAVEELLRFTTPVPCGAARIATEDVEIGGQVRFRQLVRLRIFFKLHVVTGNLRRALRQS